MPVAFTCSRALAIGAGLLLPLAETLRRWQQLGDPRFLPFWLDDWLLGLFLLYGGWRARDGTARGQAALAAAWGVACGGIYGSFFAQLVALDQPDPSGVASRTVVFIKGGLFVLALLALAGAMRGRPASGRTGGAAS